MKKKVVEFCQRQCECMVFVILITFSLSLSLRRFGRFSGNVWNVRCCQYLQFFCMQKCLLMNFPIFWIQIKFIWILLLSSSSIFIDSIWAKFSMAHVVFDMNNRCAFICSRSQSYEWPLSSNLKRKCIQSHCFHAQMVSVIRCNRSPVRLMISDAWMKFYSRYGIR